MPTLSIDEMRRIAEEVLGAIDWKDQDTGRGYCTCPGQAFHSNPNGRRDCRVTLLPGGRSEAPTVHCFHSGCQAEIQAANHRLRSAIGKAKWAAEHSSQPAKNLKRGAARPSGPKAQLSGASVAGVSSAAPPGKQDGDSRTVRTPFLNSIPAEVGSITSPRTIRTEFLHKFHRCAQARTHTHKGATGENASEVSEGIHQPQQAEQPEERKPVATDPPVPPDPAGLQWTAAKIEHGHDFRTKYTRWVGADGTVAHAHVSQDDSSGMRVIRIGRAIYQPKGGEQP